MRGQLIIVFVLIASASALALKGVASRRLGHRVLLLSTAVVLGAAAVSVIDLA